ncbi:MAG: hypothetical protein SOT81_10340 [Treponema sp.]|nr:hypothetical protein [Treponema sp.]
MQKLEENQKYPGKFSIQKDSLKEVFFNAQIYFVDKNSLEMELSYSSKLIENVNLTNFLEHTFDFYDIQGFIIVDKKKHDISLLHCFSRKSNWYDFFDCKDENSNLHNHYIKIKINAFILDAKINSNSTICNAEFKFSALSTWADSLKGKINNNILSVPFSAEWKTISNTGDELIIKNYFEEDKKNNQVSYIQSESLLLNFKEALLFDDYLEYGRIYNDFFVLMTGRKSDIEKFYLTTKDDNRAYEVIVNYKTCNPEFSKVSYFPFEYLINNLNILKNWYFYYKNTNLAYALFFDTFHFKERYMTDMLLDAYIRSFEGMITKYFSINAYFVSGNKNKKIVKEIKDLIEENINAVLKNHKDDTCKIENYTDKYKETILESFSHSYELSFRARINLFLDNHAKFFEDDFKQYNKDVIIKQIIKFRNAYAHADDSKVSTNDIFTLIRFTKKMILVHLYSDVLDMDKIQIDLNKIDI